MKKSLVALAALAAVGAASAQSTVTLSGLYTFSYQQDLTPAIPSGNTTASSTVPAKGFAVTDANFKLAAVEDLGGGLSASFDALFETSSHRGAAVTRADSSIGLSSAKLGSVALRNTRNSDLIASIGSSAIVLPDGIYDSTGIVARSAIDAVTYTTPALAGGLRLSLTYLEANDGAQQRPNVDATTGRSAYVLGATYASGPLSLAAAYKTKPSEAAAASKLKANFELSAVYNLGFATVAYAYDGKTTDVTAAAAAAQSHKAAHGVSATIPMGAVSFGVNYFKRGDAKLTEAGVRYDLSKRTNIIASYGKKSGLPETTYGYVGNQYRLRVGHSF